jgi:O-acetyl-ADP-ribose deacetylase (regulator of RNase III)
MALKRLWSDVCVVSEYRIGATTIGVVQQPWIDAPVDALVLSANNHLWLRNASGNAAALHGRCPDLHDEIMPLVPAGGLRPGEGLVTRGPGRAVIHAVTVSYNPNGHGPVAGTSSVSAACEYALDAAATHGFRSLAFSPMALRGHATGLVPKGIAPRWLPVVQAGVITSFLATGRAPELRRIEFCIDKGIPPELRSSIAAAFIDTVQVLARASR